jgi:hypothetical protein
MPERRLMIDPSIIDAKIVEARERDTAVTNKLLQEITRLPVTRAHGGADKLTSLDTLKDALVSAHRAESGVSQGVFHGSVAENGSYAYQLYSAICFVIDARAELKLLELIASPHFYAGLMKSAGMTPDA